MYKYEGHILNLLNNPEQIDLHDLPGMFWFLKPTLIKPMLIIWGVGIVATFLFSIKFLLAAFVITILFFIFIYKRLVSSRIDEFYNNINVQLEAMGFQSNYRNWGMFVNSEKEQIVLFHEDDRVLVKYPFSFISSVNRQNITEYKKEHTVELTQNFTGGYTGQVNTKQYKSYEEFRLTIGTFDKIRPEYNIRFPNSARGNQCATELRNILAQSAYN